MTVPDMILSNARVLTMDQDNPRAEAVALREGRILAVGSSDEIASLAGADTELIDAHGATVLPGFIESHVHLFMGGAELGHLQLGGIAGFDAVADKIQAFAAANPGRPMLMAQGADYAIFGRSATRRDLDRILPDRPFAMASADHHTVWANTAALSAAGLLQGRRTPGSEVVMGEDGTATGELREPEAFNPVVNLTGEDRATLGLRTGGEPDPAPTPAERAADQEIIARALAHLARHGITSAVNMDGNLYTLELLRELQDAGRLTARVKVAFHFKPFMDLDALDKASAMARDWRGDWLTSGFVKLFMDGVLDSGTAVRLDEYPDRPGWRGEPLFEPERFKEIAVEIDRRGLQIAVHAIGDGAVRAVIDGYEAARAANGPRDSRHRIEHIELIDPADVPPLWRLGHHRLDAAAAPPRRHGLSLGTHHPQDRPEPLARRLSLALAEGRRCCHRVRLRLAGFGRVGPARDQGCADPQALGGRPARRASRPHGYPCGLHHRRCARRPRRRSQGHPETGASGGPRPLDRRHQSGGSRRDRHPRRRADGLRRQDRSRHLAALSGDGR